MSFFALSVADIESTVVVCKHKSRRIPSRRDETYDCAVDAILNMNDRNGVVIGIGDVEQFAGVIDNESVRCRTLGCHRSERSGKTLDDLKRPCVDNMDGVVVGAGDEEPSVG
jgi:hypothetical protein